MSLLTEGKGWKGKIFDPRSRHTDRMQRGLCFTAGSQILSRPARPKSVISNFIFLFLLFFSQFPAHGAAQLFKALLTPSRTALTRGFLSKIVSKAQSKRIFVRTYLLFRFEYAHIYIYIYIYICMYARECQLISTRHIIYRFVINFGYNAHCHWLKERALWEHRA